MLPSTLLLLGFRAGATVTPPVTPTGEGVLYRRIAAALRRRRERNKRA